MQMIAMIITKGQLLCHIFVLFKYWPGYCIFVNINGNKILVGQGWNCLSGLKFGWFVVLFVMACVGLFKRAIICFISNRVILTHRIGDQWGITPRKAGLPIWTEKSHCLHHHYLSGKKNLKTIQSIPNIKTKLVSKSAFSFPVFLSLYL